MEDEQKKKEYLEAAVISKFYHGEVCENRNCFGKSFLGECIKDPI